MARLVYNPGESDYDVPAGTYRTRFEGCRDVDTSKFTSKFGRDDPRIEWRFRVMGGPFQSKLITWMTGTNPASPKSNAYKMLRWLLGHMPSPGEGLDPAEYVGRYYEVEWEVNPESEKGYLHIARLKEIAPTEALPPPGVAAAPPAANGAAVGGNGGPRYWINDGEGKPELRDAAWVQEALIAGRADFLMRDEGKAGPWGPPASFGFAVPF
jgi:hypothetical protein